MPARIRVVGVSGSGRTTLARTLAARLGVPHLELDAVNALDAVDTVVWLDLPRRTVTARVARRTAVRLLTRRELWNGNCEDRRSLLRRDPAENILLWTWTRHTVVRRRNEPPWQRHLDGADGVCWVRLRSPRKVRRWLEEVAP